MKLIRILSAVMILMSFAVAQDEISKVATGMAQFLKIGAGARGTALGDAFGSLVDDATAMYWNPAGIQKIKGNALAVSRTALFAGITYDYLGATMSLNRSTTVGVSVLYLSSGDIERTTIDDPEGTGDTFDTGHSSIGITVAKRLTSRFDLGVTVKYISERLFREEASTIAFDIGSQFDTGIYGIQLGMTLANFGGKMKLDGPDLLMNKENEDTGIQYSGGASWKTEEWPIPLLFRLSVNTQIIGPQSEIIKNADHRLTVIFDSNDPIDHYLRYNFGAEYEWNQMLAFRLGYKVKYDEAKYAFGLGIDLRRIGVNARLDYSFNDYGILGDVHNYTFEFRF